MEKKSMVFIVAALAAAFLIGANTNDVPDEIKAKKFVVVDADGKEMLELSSDNNGGTIRVLGKSAFDNGQLNVWHYIESPVPNLPIRKIGDSDLKDRTIQINKGRRPRPEIKASVPNVP